MRAPRTSQADGDTLRVLSPVEAFRAVRAALDAAGVKVESAELVMEPNAVVEVSGEAEARAMMRLMDSLDEQDDVDAVHANFDIPEALLEEAEAA